MKTLLYLLSLLWLWLLIGTSLIHMRYSMINEALSTVLSLRRLGGFWTALLFWICARLSGWGLETLQKGDWKSYWKTLLR